MAYLMAKGGRQEGESFEVTSKKLTIGSDFECDIMLEDPSVSQKHAIVFLAPDGSYRIIDNNSQRGIVVNGKKVLRAKIKENDVIRLGASTLVMHEGPMPEQTQEDGFESVFSAKKPDPKPASVKSPLKPKLPAKKAPPSPRRPGAPLPKRPAPTKKQEPESEIGTSVLDAVDSQRSEADRQKAYKIRRSTGFFPRRTWMIVGGFFGIIALVVAVAYLLLANKRFDDGKDTKIVINFEGKGMDMSKMKKPKGFKSDNVNVKGKGVQATQLKTMSKGGNIETSDSSGPGENSSGKTSMPEPSSGGSGAGLQGDGEGSLSNKEKEKDAKPDDSAPSGEKQVFEDSSKGGTQGDDVLDNATGKEGLDRDDLRKKIGNVGPKGRGSDYEIKDSVYQDPDMIDESYTYDDGSCERNVFVSASNGIIALTMTPTYYPAHLVEVSIFIDYDPWCSPFEIVVLVDDSSTGPNNARTVFTSDPIFCLSGRGWFTFDLGEAGFIDPLSSGNWIVGIQTLRSDGPYIGMDGSTTYPTGYRFDPKIKTWDLAGLAEIPMIRGAGTYRSSITY